MKRAVRTLPNTYLASKPRDLISLDTNSPLILDQELRDRINLELKTLDFFDANQYYKADF